MFPPNGEILVSCCLGAREDLVSLSRNDFLCFFSLSSFIDVPHHLFFLGGTLLNEDRNCNQYPLGVP
jgi:hypothetical protein